MRSGGRLRTYGRIAPRSAKTIEQAPLRAEVRATTMARAGGICAAIELVPEVRCSGPACDVDEIEGRGVNPGSHLDDEITQPLCRAHHHWKTINPKLATERGLTRRSTYELRGMATRMKA